MKRQMISFNELQKVLNPYLFTILEISEKDYELKRMNPIEYLSPNRLDILSKYLYIKNNKSHFYKEMYIRIIEKINNFVEGDFSNKIGSDSFVNSFDNLISSFELKGFDPKISVIPVDKNGNIIDGSHRIAAALSLGIDIFTVTLDIEVNHKINYSFLNYNLYPTNYLETLIHEYIKLKKNTMVAILFPNPQNSFSDAYDILDNQKSILYKKNIKLTDQGKKNLIVNLYDGENWLGDIDNNFKGSGGKERGCFKYGSYVEVVFIDNKINDLTCKKSKIRSFYGMGNDSIHTNDTYEETLKLADLFLNTNSIHLLNHQKYKYLKKVNHLLNDFGILLSNYGINKGSVLIDSGCVMGLYGIREPNDLDFIVHPSIKNEILEIHNIYYRKEQIKEYFEDPVNYFYYRGFKFLAIDKVVNMKKDRGEFKDFEDINLVNTFLNHNYITENYFDSIYEMLQTKKVICFGAGGFVYRILSLFNRVSYIVDNDKNKHGNIVENIHVYNPDKLKQESKKEIIIIVTSQFFEQIANQLEDYGFQENNEFFNGDLIWNILTNYGDQEKFYNFHGYQVSFPKGCSILKQVTNGEYEKDIVDYIISKLSVSTKMKPTFVDVGANIGLVSLAIKKKLSQSVIFSFEPRLETYNHFSNTIIRNNLNNEIYLSNVALGDYDGFTDFYIHTEKDSSGDGLIDTKRAGRTTKTTVEILKLDSWWEKNQYPHVDLIKIDVEGAEFYVLKGAKRLLNALSPNIVMEFCIENINQYPYTINDLFDLFEELGYRCTNLEKKEVTRLNYKFKTINDTIILTKDSNVI